VFLLPRVSQQPVWTTGIDVLLHPTAGLPCTCRTQRRHWMQSALGGAHLVVCLCLCWFNSLCVVVSRLW
jgi:hypothetical protein